MLRYATSSREWLQSNSFEREMETRKHVLIPFLAAVDPDRERLRKAFPQFYGELPPGRNVSKDWIIYVVDVVILVLMFGIAFGQ